MNSTIKMVGLLVVYTALYGAAVTAIGLNSYGWPNAAILIACVLCWLAYVLLLVSAFDQWRRSSEAKETPRRRRPF